MQSVPSNLPVGWRFHPTNEELLDHYLKKKNLGLPIDGSDIQELQICNLNPRDLLDDKSKERYFFCCREFYSKTGATKRKRKAGAGSWKRTGEIQSLTPEDSDQQIGTKTIFVYHDMNMNPTKWVIHEYELNSPGDFVVCKLMINKKKTNKCKSTQLHCVKNKPSKKERKGLANCKNKPNQKGRKGLANCKATSTCNSECQNSLKKNVRSTSGDAEPSSIKYSTPDFEKQNPDEITATLTSEKGQSSYPKYSVFASENKDPNPHENETFSRNFTIPCKSNNPKLCEIDPFSTVFANSNNLHPHEPDPLFLNPTSPCNSNTIPWEVDPFLIDLENSNILQGIFSNPYSKITEPCGNFHPHETDHVSNIINPCTSKPCGNLHLYCHSKITKPHDRDPLSGNFTVHIGSNNSNPFEFNSDPEHFSMNFSIPSDSENLKPPETNLKPLGSDPLSGNFTVHTGSNNSNSHEFEHFSKNFSIPSDLENLEPPETNPFSMGFSENINSDPHEMHTFSTLKCKGNYTSSLYKQSKPSCLGPFGLENEGPCEPTSVSMQNKGETSCFVESSYFDMNGKSSNENQDPSKTKHISLFRR